MFPDLMISRLVCRYFSRIFLVPDFLIQRDGEAGVWMFQDLMISRLVSRYFSRIFLVPDFLIQRDGETGVWMFQASLRKQAGH